MDGTAITAIRTGAGSALSARLLARPDASVLAILGTGVQARSHARAVCRVRPITEMRIAGRDPGKARALADELADLAATVRRGRRLRRGAGGRAHRVRDHAQRRAGGAARVARPGHARDVGRVQRRGPRGRRRHDRRRAGRRRVPRGRARAPPRRRERPPRAARAPGSSPTTSPSSARSSAAPGLGAPIPTRSRCTSRSAWRCRTRPPWRWCWPQAADVTSICRIDVEWRYIGRLCDGRRAEAGRRGAGAGHAGAGGGGRGAAVRRARLPRHDDGRARRRRRASPCRRCTSRSAARPPCCRRCGTPGRTGRRAGPRRSPPHRTGPPRWPTTST